MFKVRVNCNVIDPITGSCNGKPMIAYLFGLGYDLSLCVMCILMWSHISGYNSVMQICPFLIQSHNQINI